MIQLTIQDLQAIQGLLNAAPIRYEQARPAVALQDKIAAVIAQATTPAEEVKPPTT
jgi:hypothetical protein